MENEVNIILPTKVIGSGKKLDDRSKKKVCAYCRVSTDKEEQLLSLDNQVDEWKERLSNDKTINFVGLYIDEGVSGTSLKNRKEFNRMIQDAKAGKIDKICTKSITRFSRNALTSIEVARELREIGVEVYFDTEGISTLDPQSELIFTVYAIIAQEESRHISDNVRWTFHKMMKAGIPFLDAEHFLGYDKSPDGKKLVINKAEAEIVRLIYDLYDSGVGVSKICDELKSRGIKTVYGKTNWNNTTITSILRNEKYKGTLLQQKTFTVSFLSHKRQKNDEYVPAFYQDGAHEAIISIDQWDRVQKRLDNSSRKYIGRNRDLNKYNAQYPLSGTLICLKCGNTFKRRTWSGSDRKNIKHVYQCNGYINGLDDGHRCDTGAISETLSMKACCDVINTVYLKNPNIFKRVTQLIKETLDKENISEKIKNKTKIRDELEVEMDYMYEKANKAPTETLREIAKLKCTKMFDQYTMLTEEINALKEREEGAKANQERLTLMTNQLKKAKFTPDMLTREIIESFIYKIIAIDHDNFVFVIDATHRMSVEELIEQRHKIIEKESIYTSSITGLDPLRKKTITYKVVVI